MTKLLAKRLPLYLLILISAVVVAVIYFSSNVIHAREADTNSVSLPQTGDDPGTKQLQGYTYIRPQPSTTQPRKTIAYNGLVENLAAYINMQKAAGKINAASVYFEDLSQKQWTGINEDEQFKPGSLMKVVQLISFLRYEEDSPGILSKKLYYAAPYIQQKDVFFHSKPLQPGKSYTVKELLQYMIRYSDNNATILLDEHLKQSYFDQTLSFHKLPPPDYTLRNYPISAKQFSLFMSSIFDASYLNMQHSEFAAQLLSSCEFKEGFAKGFPPSANMIHKFGEAGNIVERQLHESAIIYVNNKQYLLTVMTKGNDINELANCLHQIAEITYRSIAG